MERSTEASDQGPDVHKVMEFILVETKRWMTVEAGQKFIKLRILGKTLLAAMGIQSLRRWKRLWELGQELMSERRTRTMVSANCSSQTRQAGGSVAQKWNTCSRDGELCLRGGQTQQWRRPWHEKWRRRQIRKNLLPVENKDAFRHLTNSLKRLLNCRHWVRAGAQRWRKP